MKKIPLLVCLAILINLSVHAQQLQRVSGKVVDDSTGTGLPDVSITVSGTNKGTTTAADGVFVLSIPADGKRHNLIFSSSGYSPVTMSLTSKTEGLSIRLKKESKQLEDVVVIGYQTVRRRDVLASVSSVSSRELKDIPLNSAEESLAGRLAGVQVTGAEGSPNAQVFIRVRGGGSITQNNAPLYVVDGIQIDNALNTISPQDIESIDVLKDAASTAIYGARGSNGVVLITTKGGRNTGGKTRIVYNGFLGVSTLEKKLPVQTPYDYMYYQFERSQQTGDSSGITPYGPDTWATVQAFQNTPAYDWQKKMLGRHAFQQTHNISLSGGTEQTQYNLSVTDNQQDAIMLNSDYTRRLLSFRFDHRASEHLKVGANIRYNNTVVDGAGTSNPGSSSLNFLRQIIRYRPFLLPGQAANTYDANYALETSANSLSLINPVLLNNAQYRHSVQNVLDLNIYANYTFTKFLSFRSTFGYDNNNTRLDAFDDTLTSNSKNNGSGMPIADITSTVLQTIDNSNVFTFTNASMGGRFKEHNDLTFIAGEETYQTKEMDNYVQTNYFPIGTIPSVALGSMNLGTPPTGLSEPKPTSNTIPITQLSFFGRVTYAYDKKYLFSASMRADESSLFGPANRWGYFPAASAAWRLSSEKFMEGFSWINDLKIRAAYGEAGNNRIAPFQYETQFNTGAQYALNNTLNTAFQPAFLPNSKLKWESTISRNLGVDASLFHDRFGFSVDVYSNTTRDLLINVTIPTTYGYTTQQQNVGSTTNKGVEVQLSSTIFQTRKFDWTASFNISFNQNRITALSPGVSSYLANSGWAGSGNPSDFIVKVGQPVGAMWGLVNDGFYTTNDFTYNPTTRVYTLNKGVASSQGVTSTLPMPGGEKFKALNGDTAVTANSRTIIGNAQPKFFGGLNQQFRYGGFDCSIFINFQYGNKVYNFNKLEFASGYTPGATLLGFMKDRWHTVDANGNPYESVSGSSVVGASPDSLNALNKGAKYWIPMVGASGTTFSPQSWAVEDASFIRINNITIGYSLPASVISKLKIARLRVYGTVNNVAVLTGYSGYDPEVNTRTSSPVTPGVDYSAYPRSRTFIAGVNVTF